jgi:hypothetical protein
VLTRINNGKLGAIYKSARARLARRAVAHPWDRAVRAPLNNPRSVDVPNWKSQLVGDAEEKIGGLYFLTLAPALKSLSMDRPLLALFL